MLLNILQCPEHAPPQLQQQRVIQPKMSIFMLMRNPSVKQKLLTATTNCVTMGDPSSTFSFTLCVY